MTTNNNYTLVLNSINVTDSKYYINWDTVLPYEYTKFKVGYKFGTLQSNISNMVYQYNFKTTCKIFYDFEDDNNTNQVLNLVTNTYDAVLVNNNNIFDNMVVDGVLNTGGNNSSYFLSKSFNYSNTGFSIGVDYTLDNLTTVASPIIVRNMNANSSSSTDGVYLFTTSANKNIININTRTNNVVATGTFNLNIWDNVKRNYVIVCTYVSATVGAFKVYVDNILLFNSNLGYPRTIQSVQFALSSAKTTVTTGPASYDNFYYKEGLLTSDEITQIYNKDFSPLYNSARVLLENNMNKLLHINFGSNSVFNQKSNQSYILGNIRTHTITHNNLVLYRDQSKYKDNKEIIINYPCNGNIQIRFFNSVTNKEILTYKKYILILTFTSIE